jgi:hypothetical protein
MEIPEEFTDNEGRGSGTMRAPDLAPIVKRFPGQAAERGCTITLCAQDRQQQFNFL